MAGTTVGEAFVKIRPDTTGFETDAKKSMGAIIGGIATGFAAIKVKEFFSASFVEAEQAQKVGAQTEAVLRSTGNAANVTAEQIGNLASKLSEVAAVDDEVIQSGANLLLTFKGVTNQAGAGNKIFDRTLAVALDLSTAMGTDLNGAIVQVGKALNDPTVGLTALTRVGVTFTEQQKDQIKALQQSGDLLGAQKIILKELTSEFGGSAAAQATATQKLNVAFGNLKESIGTALLPVISGLAKALEPVAKFFAENRVAAAALAVVIGGVLVAAMAAWTVSMLQSTVATLGLSNAVSTLGTRVGTLSVAMAPWMALAALAVGTFVGLKQALTGTAGQISATAQAFMKMSDAQLKQATSLMVAYAGYDKFAKKVLEVGETSLSTARKMVMAADLPKEKRRELLAMLDEEERAQRRAQKASEDDAVAKQKQKGAIDGVKTSLEDLNNYIRAQVDATFNLEQSQLNMEETLARYAETLRGTSADTREGRQATLDAERSISTWGESVKAAAGLAGKSTKDAAQEQINALSYVAGTLSPDSPLRKWLDEYIWKLTQGIPKDITTYVRVKTQDFSTQYGGDIPDGELPPGFAGGGFVKARPGGLLANIGEGNEDEYVLPVSKLTRIVDAAAAAAGGGAGDTFHIYTQATDTVPFALEVSRRKRRAMFLAGR